MSTSSRIIKNTGYLYIKTLVSMFVMLYVTRTVLRSLGTEDFGIYNVVGGAISMLGFVNVSMASTVQRFLNNAQGRGELERVVKIFNVSVVFHFSIALVMLLILVALFFLLFNGILNIPEDRMLAAKMVYACLIVSTFFTIISVPYDASINAHEDMLTYSIIGIIDIILKLFIAIYISKISENRLIVYGFLMMAVPIMTFLMMILYCKRHYSECEIAVRTHFDKAIAKEMISFAGWSFIGTTSSMVGNYGNGIVLNHFFGTALNAVAGIANQVQGMLSVLSVGLMRALNPVIYKTGGKADNQTLMEYSYKGCKYSFLLLAFCSIPILIETHYVLNLWLGYIPEWVILFVRLQLVRALLEQLTISLGRALEAKGKIKGLNGAMLIFDLLPIGVLSIVYYLGAPPYWHFIIAISLMVIVISIFKIYICYIHCALRIKDYIANVITPCLSVFVLTISFLYIIKICLPNEGFIRFILILIVSSLLTMVLSYMLIGNEDRRAVKKAYKAILQHK